MKFRAQISLVKDNKSILDTHSTQITQNAESIELKASVAQFINLENRFSIAESSIVANAEAITLKASEASLNLLSGRFTDAESTLSIQANQIATKVSTTDLNTTLTNYSTITQTSTAISTYVGTNVYTKDEVDNTLSNYSTITQTSNSISTFVGENVYTKGQIDTTLGSYATTGYVSGNYSTITQTANAIATRVATTDYNGNTIASLINQTSKSISLSAIDITLSGFVTFDNLSTSGQTTIDGSNIKTGTISADRIAANSISASKLNISSLSAINANVGTLTAGKIGGWDINSDTISRGKIELGSNYIRLSGSSTADATINFYNPNYNTTSRIYSYDQSKALGVDATVVRFTGGITLDGQLTCYGVSSISSTYPRSDSLYNLGSSNNRWLNGYFDNINGSTTTASDINLKTDIKDISNGVELILNLKPVQYKYKEGRSGRNHYGFIAQELKETMSLVGIPDAGVYVDLALDPQEGDDVNLLYKGLRYYELIAPIVQTIQSLEERIKRLEKLD